MKKIKTKSTRSEEALRASSAARSTFEPRGFVVRTEGEDISKKTKSGDLLDAYILQRRAMLKSEQSPILKTASWPGLPRANGDRLDHEQKPTTEALQRSAVADSQAAQEGPYSDAKDDYQRIPSSAVLQLIYLWDRSKEKAPHWSNKEPPPDYLPSGNYQTDEHGRDTLYVRLKGSDLFYGISYEDDPKFEIFLKALQKIATTKSLNINDPKGLAAAVVEYEKTHGPPLLDVVAYQAIYGGGTGWERYSSYINKGSSAGWAIYIQSLNKGLPWSPSKAGFGCQISMIAALMQGGSVRFLLDGLKNVKGIIEGSAYKGNITSHELRMAVGILDSVVNLGNKSVRPQDGVNVFFYLKKQLISADHLAFIGQSDVKWLAMQAAKKIAEEEEWDDDDPDIDELAVEFAKLTAGELLEILLLP